MHFFEKSAAEVSLTYINPSDRGLLSLARSPQEVAMRKITIKRTFLAAAALVFGMLVSIQWSSGTTSIGVESAQARVGRPLTPVSVAGVARRTTRRAVVGGAAVGAAAYGSGCVRVLVNGTYVCR
jgi:hypothetical protein